MRLGRLSGAVSEEISYSSEYHTTSGQILDDLIYSKILASPKAYIIGMKYENVLQSSNGLLIPG